MPSTAAPTSAHLVQGWLHPASGEQVHPAEVLAHLRSERVLAAVATEGAGVDDLCDVTLLLDDADRVLRVIDGRVVSGPPLDEFGPAVVDTLGVALEIAGHFFDLDEPLTAEDLSDAPGDEEFSPDDLDHWDTGEWDAGEEFPDVVLCKAVPSTLPVLAHGLGSGLVAGHVDGWTLALLDEAGVDVAGHGWAPSELPALQLTRVGDERYVQIVTGLVQTAPTLLHRFSDMEATFAPGTLPAVELLANPHLATDSEMRALLATKHFRHVDADRLATALQSPAGADWSARVLAALGLPTIAADVMEGRASVPSPERFDVLPLGRTMLETFDRYYDAPDSEVARRTAYGRAFAAITRTPARVATVATVEVVAGALLVVTARSKRRGVRALLTATGVGLLTDAASHALLAPRKFRHRG